jgi:hypothetical protein
LDGDGNGTAINDMGAYEYISAAADTDQDGIDDNAECTQYGTNPTQADTDGDGQSDQDEIFARMDPNDADDFFGVRQFQQQTAGMEIVLEWPSSTECSYTVYHCGSLAEEWSAVPGWETVPGTGSLMFYTIPVGTEPDGFYRVMSELNP